MILYRLSSEAFEDLRNIERYIALFNPSARRKMRKEIQIKCQFLGQHPRLTAPQKRYQNLSKHKVGNYLIFYRPLKAGIEIIRVLHASRDVESILSKPH